MTTEELLDLSLLQLRIAFEVVLTSYEEVRRTGRISDLKLTAAALSEIEVMFSGLSALSLEGVSYDGSHVNELLRRGRKLLTEQRNGEGNARGTHP